MFRLSLILSFPSRFRLVFPAFLIFISHHGFFLCTRRKQLCFLSLSFINFIFLAFPPAVGSFCHASMFYTVSQSHQLLPLLCDSSIICSQFGLCLLPRCTFFSYIHPPSVKSLQHAHSVFTVTVCPDFSSPGFLIFHPSGLCLCHRCQLFSLPPLLCLSLLIRIVSLTISLVLQS